MVLRRKDLVERIAADKVALAPRPAIVSSIPPEYVSIRDNQNKNLEGTY